MESIFVVAVVASVVVKVGVTIDDAVIDPVAVVAVVVNVIVVALVVAVVNCVVAVTVVDTVTVVFVIDVVFILCVCVTVSVTSGVVVVVEMVALKVVFSHAGYFGVPQKALYQGPPNTIKVQVLFSTGTGYPSSQKVKFATHPE